MIDFCIVSVNLFQCVLDIRVKQDLEPSTDRYFCLEKSTQLTRTYRTKMYIREEKGKPWCTIMYKTFAETNSHTQT